MNSVVSGRSIYQSPLYSFQPERKPNVQPNNTSTTSTASTTITPPVWLNAKNSNIDVESTNNVNQRNTFILPPTPRPITPWPPSNWPNLACTIPKKDRDAYNKTKRDRHGDDYDYDYDYDDGYDDGYTDDKDKEALLSDESDVNDINDVNDVNANDVSENVKLNE
jgi:hypothetical protein